MEERLLGAARKLQELYDQTGLHIEAVACFDSCFLEGENIVGKFIFCTETKRYCVIIEGIDDFKEIFV